MMNQRIWRNLVQLPRHLTRACTLGLCFLCVPLSGHCEADPATATGYTEEGTVAIYRDEWGVPHIYAKDEADGFFGAGYALAGDNLENILGTYLGISGRAAAAFGPDYVATDFAALHWRVAEDAKVAFRSLDASLQANYRAFVAGVEHFMDSNPDRTPDWAPALEPWMPVASTHSLVLLLSVFLDRQGFDDCRLATVPNAWFRSAGIMRQSDPVILANRLSGASNQWVISPRRDGAHHLVSWADSHSAFARQRDEIRIHAGNFHATGIVPAGMAMPLIGHNRDLAWSFTAGGPDTSDCYALELNSEDHGQYRYDDKWKDFVARPATVQVEGGAPVTRILEYTDHNGRLNPVIAKEGTVAYAISTAYSGKAEAGERTIYGMNNAASVDEFIDALSHLGLFPENVMVGDRRGESFYVSVGRTPRRPVKVDPRSPLNGDSPGSEWTGEHPFDDLVQLRNPEAGWMQNNNIAPDTMIPDSPLEADLYPSYIFNIDAGHTNERAERAKVLLSEMTSFSVADLIKLGMDELWPYTPQWQRALRYALTQTGAAAIRSDEAGRLLDRLLAFDGMAHEDSTVALEWYFWRLSVDNLATKTEEDPEALTSVVESESPLSDSQGTILVDAIQESIGVLRDRLGPGDWALGDVFRIGRADPTFPLGGIRIDLSSGSERTLRAMRCNWTEDGKQCLAYSGQAHPMLTVFSDPLVSYSAVPFGQSVEPGSKHYSDQSALASSKQLKPVWFKWSDLRKHISSRTLLKVPQSAE